MPIIPPNNTTGLYGVDTTVSVGNTLFATNLNISGNAAVGNNITAGGQISAAGNITAGSGSYFLGDGSLLTGIASNYGNVDVANYLANFGSNVITTTGNITAGNLIPTGNLVGNVLGTLVQSPGNANVVIKSAAPSNDPSGNGIYLNASTVYVGNNIARLSATPSVDLTLTVATSGTSTPEITLTQTGGGGFRGGTGNIDIRASGSAGLDPFRIVNGNINMAGNVYIGGYGYQTSPNSWGNLQVNGNIRTNNAVNASTMSATGNITGNYFLGNGSALTGITATASPAGANTELQFNDGGTTGASANLTFNKSTNVLSTTAITTTGNITTSGNVNITGFLNAITNTSFISFPNIPNTGSMLLDAPMTGAGTISLTGNITGGNLNATNLLRTDEILSTVSGGNITFNSTPGSSGDGNVKMYDLLLNGNLSASGTITGTLATNAQPNITSVGTLSSLSVVGNVDSGNVNTGAVSATGNISTGAFFKGDGSLLTNLPGGSPGGNTTEVQFNNAGSFAGDSLFTWNTATAVANIGNVSIQGSIINSVNAFNGNANPNPFRLTYGNGYNNDYSSTSDPLGIVRNAQLAVFQKQASSSSDTNQGVRGYSGLTYNDLSGETHTNNLRRAGGSASTLWLGNGTLALTQNQYLGASGGAATLATGNIGTVSMGNVTLGHSAGTISSVITGGGANIGNAVGHLAQVQTQSASGNVTTAIGYSTQFLAPGVTPTTPPTTVIGYYMPAATATYGMSSASPYRGAANYFFLKNDDNAAQNQMGSLRAYHEYNGVSSTTSGSLTINKNDGQVQQVNLTGNVSSLAYSNFVSSASDGTNTDEECDTVTIVFNQGSTGNYGITFPTGSTYKYAGNVTALQSVAANSVSLVSVSAVRIGGTTTYLTTISPGFV